LLRELINLKIVFPGSFDPITTGHLNLIERVSILADELFVVVLENSAKRSFFSKEDRVAMVKMAVEPFQNVKAEAFDGMTVEYCRRVGADYIIRGLRNSADYLFEKEIAAANRKLSGIETLFLPSDGKFDHISSSIVRELIAFDADLTGFAPECVINFINKTRTIQKR
jgi:pantetheine-phosphate adenylyltransferase